MSDLDDLRTLTTEAIAEILGVRPEAVRIWARTGKLEAMRWGRRLRFRPEAVLEFQEAQRIQVPNARDFIRRMRAEGPGRGGRRGRPRPGKVDQA
jgi:excisionase family DNA binding protein